MVGEGAGDGGLADREAEDQGEQRSICWNSVAEDAVAEDDGAEDGAAEDRGA
jgi:hypothetical protein